MATLACDGRATPSSDTATDIATTDSASPEVFVADAAPPDLAEPDAATDGWPASHAEQVVLACAVAAGCAEAPVGSTPPLPSHMTGLCVEGFATAEWPLLVPAWTEMSDAATMHRLLDCAAKHRSACKAFHTCYGGTWVALGPCRKKAACSGDKVVGISDPNIHLDCASLGQSCLQTADYTCCTKQPCTSGCATATTGSLCVSGVQVATDCAAWGLVCAQGSCAGTGGPCNDMKPTCLSATKVEYCKMGKLATFDCSQSPFLSTCQTGNSIVPCGFAGSACTSSDHNCQGDWLVICLDGNPHQVDCKALGFKGCSQGTGVARCSH